MEDMVTVERVSREDLGQDPTRDMFSFMKRSSSLDDLATRSLAIKAAAGNTPRGYLVPLGDAHVGDSALIEAFATWRDAHQFAYPTRFEVTPSGTEKWLSDGVVANPDRLLFVITDSLMRPLGHIGLLILPTGDLEVDNVLRGVGGHPGLMRDAMSTLEDWALEHLDAQSLQLRVLESNAHAVDFYESLGYTHIERTALAWTFDGADRSLVPDEEGLDDTFLTMAKDLQAAQPAAEDILTAGPLIGAREAAFCLDAARHGWNNQHSEYLNTFQSEFAEYVDGKFAIATSSCTGALHLALLALGVGAGDEVIVPETTWVATATAVAYTGAVPVFADVDPEMWTLTAEGVRSALSERTKAVMPVHLYGYAADMQSLSEVCSDAGVAMVEDAAPAIGTLIGGRPAGSFGTFGCYSFQGAKMLVTGEGGMLVTSDEELYRRAWKQQDHGRVPGTFWIDEVGRKYKMSNLTAALGLAQLKSSELQIAKKRRINHWYREFLDGVANLTFQQEAPGTRSICWMTSVRLTGPLVGRATELAGALRKHGVDTRPVFPPISTYPIWPASPSAASPVASEIAVSALNLPSGVRLSRASVEKVADVIRRYVDDVG